jgi:opacity protein-like surface antigen
MIILRSLMMRKILLIALCFLVLGSTAFAIDLVIGGGGQFGWAQEQYNYPTFTHDVDATIFGGFVFFGLNRFMEASIAVYAGNNEYVENPGGPGEALSTQVGVSLYAKYPIPLGSYFVIFPTLGTDIQNNCGGLDLWLGGGLGLDIFFGQKLFLRAQGIYRAGALMIYKGFLNEDAGAETEFPSHGPLFKLGLGWMY